MKIDINELKNVDSIAYTLNGTIITLSLKDDELSFNVEENNYLFKKDEKTKEWFNNVVTKADEYANKMKPSFKEKCKTISNDEAVDNILQRMKNDNELRQTIKSMSKYGEMTNEERAEFQFGINVKGVTNATNEPSVISTQTEIKSEKINDLGNTFAING